MSLEANQQQTEDLIVAAETLADQMKDGSSVEEATDKILRSPIRKMQMDELRRKRRLERKNSVQRDYERQLRQAKNISFEDIEGDLKENPTKEDIEAAYKAAVRKEKALARGEGRKAGEAIVASDPEIAQIAESDAKLGPIRTADADQVEYGQDEADFQAITADDKDFGGSRLQNDLNKQIKDSGDIVIKRGDEKYVIANDEPTPEEFREEVMLREQGLSGVPRERVPKQTKARFATPKEKEEGKKPVERIVSKYGLYGQPIKDADGKKSWPLLGTTGRGLTVDAEGNEIRGKDTRITRGSEADEIFRPTVSSQNRLNETKAAVVKAVEEGKISVQDGTLMIERLSRNEGGRALRDREREQARQLVLADAQRRQGVFTEDVIQDTIIQEDRRQAAESAADPSRLKAPYRRPAPSTKANSMVGYGEERPAQQEDYSTRPRDPLSAAYSRRPEASGASSPLPNSTVPATGMVALTDEQVSDALEFFDVANNQSAETAAFHRDVIRQNQIDARNRYNAALATTGGEVFDGNRIREVIGENPGGFTFKELINAGIAGARGSRLGVEAPILSLNDAIRDEQVYRFTDKDGNVVAHGTASKRLDTPARSTTTELMQELGLPENSTTASLIRFLQDRTPELNDDLAEKYGSREYANINQELERLPQQMKRYGKTIGLSQEQIDQLPDRVRTLGQAVSLLEFAKKGLANADLTAQRMSATGERSTLPSDITPEVDDILTTLNYGSTPRRELARALYQLGMAGASEVNADRKQAYREGQGGYYPQSGNQLSVDLDLIGDDYLQAVGRFEADNPNYDSGLLGDLSQRVDGSANLQFGYTPGFAANMNFLGNERATFGGGPINPKTGKPTQLNIAREVQNRLSSYAPDLLSEGTGTGETPIGETPVPIGGVPGNPYYRYSRKTKDPDTGEQIFDEARLRKNAGRRTGKKLEQYIQQNRNRADLLDARQEKGYKVQAQMLADRHQGDREFGVSERMKDTQSEELKQKFNRYMSDIERVRLAGGNPTNTAQPIQAAPTPQSVAPVVGEPTGNQPAPAVDAGRGGWMGGPGTGRVVNARPGGALVSNRPPAAKPQQVFSDFYEPDERYDVAGNYPRELNTVKEEMRKRRLPSSQDYGTSGSSGSSGSSSQRATGQNFRNRARNFFRRGAAGRSAAELAAISGGSVLAGAGLNSLINQEREEREQEAV